MLEVLTESSDTKETKERVASVLEEQRKTLRFAMSRPQVNLLSNFQILRFEFLYLFPDTIRTI